MDKMYLLTLVHTLGRMREVNRLKWEDVDFDRGFVTLYTRKAKCSDLKPVRIPMNDDLRTVLENVPRTGEYVSPNPKTGTAYDHRDKLLHGLCKEAGVKDFTYHCLRHFGASKLDDGGAPLSAIQSLLGHERPTTTDHYLQGLRGGGKEAIRKLEGISAPQIRTPKNEKGVTDDRNPLIFFSAPRVIRTPDLRIRSPSKYLFLFFPPLR